MSTETARVIAKKEGDEVKPIVIDFGKHSRKNIKRVRAGRSGKILDKVQEVVAQLREDGVMAGSAQPIVIVVRQRRRSRGALPGLLR